MRNRTLFAIIGGVLLIISGGVRLSFSLIFMVMGIYLLQVADLNANMAVPLLIFGIFMVVASSVVVIGGIFAIIRTSWFIAGCCALVGTCLSDPHLYYVGQIMSLIALLFILLGKPAFRKPAHRIRKEKQDLQSESSES